MSNSAGPVPPERWLDIVRVSVHDDDAKAVEQLGKQVLEHGLPAIPDFVQLPSTEFERNALLTVQDVINVIRKKCGQSPFSVSPDRLHIVESASLRAKLGRDCQGYETLGRIYISDAVRVYPTSFAYTLSHEMSHVSSYSAAWFNFEMQAEKAVLTDVFQTRSGLQRHGSDGKPELHGLNEAVTEYLASLIRIVLSHEEGDFAKDCAAKAYTIDTDYATITALTNTLCRELGRGYRDDWTCTADVWACLLIDYWSGSDDFLDWLAGPYPDMAKDLRQLDTNAAQAKEFANRYGLRIDFGSK